MFLGNPDTGPPQAGHSAPHGAAPSRTKPGCSGSVGAGSSGSLGAGFSGSLGGVRRPGSGARAAQGRTVANETCTLGFARRRRLGFTRRAECDQRARHRGHPAARGRTFADETCTLGFGRRERSAAALAGPLVVSATPWMAGAWLSARPVPRAHRYGGRPRSSRSGSTPRSDAAPPEPLTASPSPEVHAGAGGGRSSPGTPGLDWEGASGAGGSSSGDGSRIGRGAVVDQFGWRAAVAIFRTGRYIRGRCSRIHDGAPAEPR